MSTPQPVTSVGARLNAALAFYRRHLRLVLQVTFPVVAFVDLVVGAGLGELTASVHKHIPTGYTYIDLAASELVTIPLVTAMLARAIVIDASTARRPVVREVALDGLDLFAPAFAAVLIFVVGVFAGLILIVPGIYLAVLWYFVVQTVVVDHARGAGTVTLSAALVRGAWWRSAGIGLAFQLTAGIPALLLASAFEALSRAANSDALIVIGNIAVDTLALPFVAIGATLYYLELRTRAGMPAPS